MKKFVLFVLLILAFIQCSFADIEDLRKAIDERTTKESTGISFTPYEIKKYGPSIVDHKLDKVGRYQIFDSMVLGGGTNAIAPSIMLDTATGRSWQYSGKEGWVEIQLKTPVNNE